MPYATNTDQQLHQWTRSRRKLFEKVNASNRRQQIVEENNLLRKKVTNQSIESFDLVDFPKLSVDARDITLNKPVNGLH